MLISIILLSLLLSTSLIINFFLWKAADRQLEMNELYVSRIAEQLEMNELYVSWIADWKSAVFKTFSQMKMLDEKQMFEKDDEVGVVFEDMKALIESLNDRTEETTNTE